MTGRQQRQAIAARCFSWARRSAHARGRREPLLVRHRTCRRRGPERPPPEALEPPAGLWGPRLLPPLARIKDKPLARIKDNMHATCLAFSTVTTRANRRLARLDPNDTTELMIAPPSAAYRPANKYAGPQRPLFGKAGSSRHIGGAHGRSGSGSSPRAGREDDQHAGVSPDAEAVELGPGVRGAVLDADTTWYGGRE